MTEKVGTACIPCSLSHLSTCVGLLNEAARFARKDITDPEVTKRTDMCLAEITAMERVDLAPENVVSLPEKERELATELANKARDIRHGLEWFKSSKDIEDIAAKTAELQHDVSRKWLLTRVGKEDQAEKGSDFGILMLFGIIILILLLGELTTPHYRE